MMKFAPGQANLRSEDQRLLTGKGRFADDLVLPGQAYAAMVRSPHAHARLLAVDATAALEMPGVLAVLTAEDWEADGLGGALSFIKFLPEPLLMPDGREATVPLRKPLVRDRVTFVGEAVAVVIAQSPALAVDAVEAVMVDYQELPAVADTATCFGTDVPLVREDVPGNVLFVHDFGDAVAAEAAIARAPHVVRQRRVNNRVHANPMEPRAINAVYDPARETFTIWGGTQNSHVLREILATHAFHIPEDKIEIVAGDLGGSFGLKAAIPPEMLVMPWAARKLGRPVKWTATRSEMIIADNHGRDLISEAELAFDDEGRFLAVRSHNIANHGAHIEIWGAASALVNVGGIAGNYTIPAAHVKVTGVLSHTSPLSPYRGAGRPEASYIIECLIDEAAAKLGMDRVEIRRRNLIPASAMPYKTALTFTYDSGDFGAVLDKATTGADYAGFAARRAESEARGMLRGIGVALCVETSVGPGQEYAELVFDPEGRAEVLAGSTAHGQGHENAFVQFVSHELGVPPDWVTVIEGDTRVVKKGIGTGGSRSAAFNAAAIGDAIAKCIDQGRPIAARLLQAKPGDLVFKDTHYAVEGGARLSFLEVVRASFQDGAGIGAMGEANFTSDTFTNGCQVSEVEVDPATGRVKLLAHTICDDVGFELNPMLVRGQLIGGMAQGAGQALMEDMVIDANGQVLTGSFMDYAMPRATDLINVTTLSNPVPTPTNPYGVKGVGESGTVGALPAVMLAINDALASGGASPVDMPATPRKVWRALRSVSA